MRMYAEKAYIINKNENGKNLGESVIKLLDFILEHKEESPEFYTHIYHSIMNYFRDHLKTNNLLALGKTKNPENWVLYEFDRKTDGTIYNAYVDENGKPYIEIED